MARARTDRSPISNPRQVWTLLTSRRGTGAPRRAARLAVDRDEERDDQDRDDVGDLDHRVDRGACGVLVGVADGVAGDGGGVGLGALAAEGAVLDRLLRVVPRAAARGHGD